VGKRPSQSFDEVTGCSYNQAMRFVWDEHKRRRNLEKHGIDFADVPALFDGDVFTIADERFDYGETRYMTLGLLQARVIVVAHTDTGQVIRLISARKATNHEAKKYFQEIGY
jgi:uncharacterized DUF497 family protein